MRSKLWNFLLANNLYGLLAGIIFAMIGSILFAIIECIHLIATYPGLNLSNVYFLEAIFVYSVLFSFVPGGIGGWILGLVLRSRFRKGSLKIQNIEITGSLLAGLAVMIICCSVVLFVLITPHGGAYLWAVDDLGIWKFIVKLTNDLFILAGRFGVEIVAAIVIACSLGGWAGRIIAKQMTQIMVNT